MSELDPMAERQFVERRESVNEMAVGTILEYQNWQWAVVSEIATDRDEPMVGFILVDDVGDEIIKRLEHAIGCRQHYEAVEHLRDTEHEYWAPVEYVIGDDVWTVLGPIHPNFRSEATDGGDRA